jgi:hypothetical protein
MPFQPPRPSSVLASVLAAAGIMLAAAGCSHLTPLGPDPAPSHAVVAPPAPKPLGSPIILQVMRGEPATSAGGCPAGSVAVSVPKGATPPGPLSTDSPSSCPLPTWRP